MVRRGGRGRFSQFRGRGRRPHNERDTQQRDMFLDDNDYQANNYFNPSDANAIIQGINDLHLGNVVDEVDNIVAPTPSTSSPPVVQQQPSRRRAKQPGWVIEEEVKLVNYVCNNYELLNNNKKLFWREFGKNSEKILHYPRSAESCKTKFYSLVARYHQNADLYDAIERYLDLEEGLVSPRRVPLLKRVSQSIEKQESLSTTSVHEETTSPSTLATYSSNETQAFPLSKAPRDETQSISSQVAKFSMETKDPREIPNSLPRDSSNIRSKYDGRVSGTTSPINDPSSPPGNAILFVPRNTSSKAAAFCNYNTSSLTSNSSSPCNDFSSFIESIRQQIVAAQDYLNREKSHAEDHINSLDSVLHLFAQLEDQLQRMK